MKLSRLLYGIAVLSIALFARSRWERGQDEAELSISTTVGGGVGKWTSVTRPRGASELIWVMGAKSGEQPVSSSGRECECGKRYITTIYWSSYDRCDVFAPCPSCGKVHTIKQKQHREGALHGND